MAIRVIRHGKKRVVECPNCECLFEYEREDVKCTQIGYNEHVHNVPCPNCKQEIEVNKI